LRTVSDAEEALQETVVALWCFGLGFVFGWKLKR
jgi:hypothetical protein